MKSSDRYTLGRKRIVNARVSEAEYRRLRSHAASEGVSLSHLMRLGIEPFIRPRDGCPEPAADRDNDTVEARGMN